MAVERLESSDVVFDAVGALGLDPDAVDLFSIEAIAGSVRRAASFLCPTTPGAVARAVTDVLSGLPGFDQDTRVSIDGVVDALVSYGDLLELPLDDAGGKRRHLFLGPPTYVLRSAGCILLGVRPDGAPLVSDELLAEVEYDGHVRVIRSDTPEAVAGSLAAEGLAELNSDHWFRPPRATTPEETAAVYTSRLRSSGPSGSIDGVRVIDPSASVTYYRGRWRPLQRRDDGDFVARRPQAFGADLWCFAEVRDGEVTKLVDLPLESQLAPGSDEAWRLQAALDATAGRPQQLRVRAGPRPEIATLDLYSPLPSWAQRRLDFLSTNVMRSRGALFSYSLPRADVHDELEFLRRMMWLTIEAEETADSDE